MTGFEIALTCLALNVFKEARGEHVTAQHAVALVTLNRAREKDGDICAVVFAPKQFSWTITDTRDGVLLKSKRPKRKTKEWKRAERSALEALYIEDFTGGATHYHAVSVKPYWSKHLDYIGQWGSHKFYKERRK